MKIIILLLVLISVFAGGIVKAETCTDIDVRDRLQGEMKEHYSKATHQGKIGWCYAYAAADLISFKVKKPVSAFHIGLLYSESTKGLGALVRGAIGLKKSGLYEGGYPVPAVKMMKDRGGICLEKDVNSRQDNIGLMPMALESIEKTLKAKNFMEEDFIIKMFLQERLPNEQPTEALAYLRTQAGQPPVKALRMLTEKACAANAIGLPSTLKAINVSKKDVGSLRPTVDRILKSGQPVAIQYRTTRFIDPAYHESALYEALSQHISTIVGRKKIGNQCVYTIRNSWGADCTPYRQGIFCNQQEGTFQIPVEELDLAAFAVDYMAK